MTGFGCSCPYKYGNGSHPASPWPDWMYKLASTLQEIMGLGNSSFSGCNLNRYDDGTQSLFWHQDDEPLMKTPTDNVTILSLSLGATREFRYKSKYHYEHSHVHLADGDLLVMTGSTQTHLSHCLPTDKLCLSPRYNLTFRFITNHRPGCKVDPTRRPHLSCWHPQAH